ncbi:MAG: 16S rRNA (adenine(1518)-N(6)/adenine(1519)-N(6))-dimethyltransferase RsmA [bacterium]
MPKRETHKKHGSKREEIRSPKGSSPHEIDSAPNIHVTEMSPEELEQRLARLRASEPVREETGDRLAAPIGYIRKHGGLPPTKKSLGQNCLLDAGIALEIVQRLEVEKGSLVVEVGPGPGALTEHLLRAGAEVVAIEIDSRMVEHLRERWPEEPNLTVIHENILDADLDECTGWKPFAVIGNLPYNITSSLLFHLLDFAREHPGQLTRLMVMLQLEVAKRACALPGDSDYGQLAVMLRLWGDPEIVMTVPKEMFTPAPKVDGGIVRMDVAAEPRWPVPHYDTFRRLVKGVFTKRRKMLRNSLPAIPNLAFHEGLDVDLTRRPQTLSTEEYAHLATQLIPKRERHGND